MKFNKARLTSENGLRQKAVNLFYLIFLILIFSFIPSDFIDSTYHANESLDLISEEAKILNNTSSKYFLHLLKNEPELLFETKDKILLIEDITNNTIAYIEDLKKRLIAVDKQDSYGFLKFGKEENTTKELMLQQKGADSLFGKLEAFKMTIADYVTSRDMEEVNKILPLPTYIQNSEGNYIPIADFYFNRTPLNIAILNLSQFKSRVERVRSLAYQKIIKSILFENARLLPFENLKLAESEKIEDLIGNTSIKDFFEKLDPKDFVTGEAAKIKTDKDRYYIESLTDTIHPMGKAIQYYAYFDTAGTKNLNITVTSDDATEKFNISKPGTFYYFPNSKGRYTFTFTNGKKVTAKNITVIDTDPIIQNSQLSTLYIGLDNPLSIKTSEFDENDNLYAEITDGQIIKKGGVFYARVFKKGITQVKVYVNMPYGKIKVAEKSFVIRLLQDPIPSINEIKNGGIVKKESLSQFKVMSLQTDEYLVDEDVYIADFDFMIIYNQYNAVTKPIKNVGSSFNGSVIGALKKAEKGDVLLFNNIRTLSSRGVETIIPSLTLTVY